MDKKNRTAQRDSHDSAVIVGLGKGGCSTVYHMARKWKDRPELVVMDTDISAIPKSKHVTCVHLGSDVMKNMGTGGDPRVGHRAAEADIDVIRDLFKDTDIVFLVVGLGGGTGTGAAPLVIEEAGKANALTLCFAILPFDFEGKRRMECAERGIAALKEVADGIICMPNQRLFKTGERRGNISKAFHRANDVLSKGINAVWQGVCRDSGVNGINLEFADLCALVKNSSGRCIFGCAEGAGRNKVGTVLKAIQNNPFLDQGQVMKNAYSFLVSIAGGPDLSLQEVDQIMDGVLSIAGKDALIKTSVVCEPDRKNKVFLMILVSEKRSDHESERMESTASAEGSIGSSKEKKESDRLSRKKKLIQTSLFDGRGRFKEVDPTIVDGNNLDIPTYIRRGILIQKARNNTI